MRRTEALQGVRMIKFRSVLERYEASELNQIDAAALLGISERTFRRWCVRFEDGGEAGLLDRRLGQASGRRVPTEREQQIETLYRTRYSGFTAKHFHEHLVRDHGFSWGYTWTKVFLQSKGLLSRAKTRGAHRRKRPRRPLPGMMLHQDGSRHEWIAGLDAMDLIVTMDDATNTIYSGFLVPEEGTASTFQALLEVFGQHGLPLSLYTDRGSHYFYTPEAGGPVTQVGRAPSGRVFDPPKRVVNSSVWRSRTTANSKGTVPGRLGRQAAAGVLTGIPSRSAGDRAAERQHNAALTRAAGPVNAMFRHWRRDRPHAMRDRVLRTQRIAWTRSARGTRWRRSPRRRPPPN